jgi:hypothetical protein
MKVLELPMVEPWPIHSRSTEQPQRQSGAFPFSFHPDVTPAGDEQDLVKIMNYLGNVFPLQFYSTVPRLLNEGEGGFSIFSCVPSLHSILRQPSVPSIKCSLCIPPSLSSISVTDRLLRLTRSLRGRAGLAR